MVTLLPKSDVIKSIKYPSINPVYDDKNRPLWSVMIPTYNGTKYLEQTLNSVLEQDPGLNEMQIEVIDDCSTKDDPEAIVRKVGNGRISFSRQPHNVGLVNNWNTCIQKARGHWVHILHQDDIILPGFYSHLKEATNTEQSMGAVFCRHVFIDEEGDWQSLSSIERRKPGILSDWIERIAVRQLIQFASIVVKRCVYEEIGGFFPEVHYAADWDMWKRIAAYYPVWYEPQLLACYRMHSASESSRLVSSGANVADILKSIEISESYLPNKTARELSCRARENSALYALSLAYQMLAKDDLAATIAQAQAALQCSYSFKVVKSVVNLFRQVGMRVILQTIPKLRIS